MGIQRETGKETNPTPGCACCLVFSLLLTLLPSQNTSPTLPRQSCALLTLPSHSQSSKAHLKITQKELKDLQWEHEVLEQRFSKVRPAGRAGHPIPSPNLQTLCRGQGVGLSRAQA